MNQQKIKYEKKSRDNVKLIRSFSGAQLLTCGKVKVVRAHASSSINILGQFICRLVNTLSTRMNKIPFT